MNATLWALQAMLAAVFLGAGLLKATQNELRLVQLVGEWVHDVPLPVIRLTGTAEIAGALGLVLPAAVTVAPSLTWIAATGLVVTMLGAITVHGRRGERHEVTKNLVLAALLVVVVWGRLGPYAFAS